MDAVAFAEQQRDTFESLTTLLPKMLGTPLQPAQPPSEQVQEHLSLLPACGGGARLPMRAFLPVPRAFEKLGLSGSASTCKLEMGRSNEQRLCTRGVLRAHQHCPHAHGQAQGRSVGNQGKNSQQLWIRPLLSTQVVFSLAC